MGISFAGVDLIHPDPDGKIQDWFDSWLPTSESRMILDWPEPQTAFGVSPYYVGQTLPLPNWSKPPRPKINSWYRPTGASRWGFGFFLCDYARLQTILSAIGTSNAAQILVLDMSPATGHARMFPGCYLLPPHPVSADITDVVGLWILPIVDQRWYWQFATGAATPIDNSAPTTNSWASIFTQLGAVIGTLFQVDTIPAVYLYPSPFFLSGVGYGTIANFLDACAYSVGQRIIPQYPAYGADTTQLANGWLSANWATSQARRAANLTGAADAGTLQAGNLAAFPNVAAIAPAAVQVFFRAYKNGIVVGDWKTLRYSKTISAATANYAGGVSTVFSATVVSTALADYTTGAGVPDNQGTLDALALQIAVDYYSGIWVQDSAVTGISQWQESGYDDFVEFCPGRPDDIDNQPSTRVHSIPYNQQAGRMIHYDPTTWEYGERISGVLAGPLAAGGTAVMNVHNVDGAIPAGTPTVVVSEILNNAVANGTNVQAIRYGDKWGVLDPVALPLAGTIIYGTTSALVMAGGTGTFTIPAGFGGGTVSALCPYGICLPSPDSDGNVINYLLGKLVDGSYQVINPLKMFYVEFLAGGPYIAPGFFNFDAMSGNAQTLAPIAVPISVYVRNGVAVPLRKYLCFVNSQNQYELMHDGLFFSGFSNDGLAHAAGFPATAVNMNCGTFGVVSVALNRGCISGLGKYTIGMYLDGDGLAEPAAILNPSTAFYGTLSAGIAPGVIGAMTGLGAFTGMTVNVQNRTNDTIAAARTFVAFWLDAAGGGTNGEWAAVSGRIL